MSFVKISIQFNTFRLQKTTQ